MGELSVSRRGLLGGLTATAALGALSACDADPVIENPPPVYAPLDPSDWASVRHQFLLDTGRSQFAAFVFASPPAEVRAAIARHRDGLDRDTVGYLHAQEENARQRLHLAAGKYLGGSGDQVYFTDSTTMGLGLLYGGIALRPGDEVLTTEHDFYSTHESLRLRAARDGVTVRRVRLFAEPATASADQIVQALTKALTPATRIVAVTWVHSSTGLRMPIRAVADALAAHNRDLPPQRRALLCVDGVHGFGAVDAGPAELGCDFLVSGCHKWLFGPRGTGLVWGRPEAWARFRPTIPTFETAGFAHWLGVDPALPAPSASPGGYHSFEHLWALEQAFDFHAALTRRRVAERTATLATRLKEGLAGISGVRVVTPRSAELSAGLVCCALEAMNPGAAVSALLGKDVVASTTPYDPSYLRFGTSIVTNEADVDRAVAAVREIS
ncbi:class V aminotransferase [Catellatospora methionotrophica]|uniref:Class V aminotransferase n=1 Tax=Catellatospora methionotrophica TaxID=121620 RepID=A0A8J3LJM9_9ACTN|nr:aminotransferase class V-fold PLP-dependent enzyme [Catellatospora methionotrophica]GIG13920.1 class V aminotransferase [Catellatospora methionotrophica]